MVVSSHCCDPLSKSFDFWPICSRYTVSLNNKCTHCNDIPKLAHVPVNKFTLIVFSCKLLCLVEVARIGCRLELYRRAGVYHPYWDAVISQLSALDPAQLLTQLMPDQLAAIASIVSLHRYCTCKTENLHFC